MLADQAARAMERLEFRRYDEAELDAVKE